MKTFLLFVCGLIFLRANPQCTVSDIFVQNVVVTSAQPGGCSVKFDATFTLESNNGNKYIFLHAWTQQEYPDYFECVDGVSSLPGSIRSPEASDLGNEFMTIGINNDAAVPVLLSVYPPDPSVPITPVDSVKKVILPDGRAIFYLFGIRTTIPVTCGTPSVIVADLWSSQSANAQRAHCVNCGIRSSAGFITAVGLVNCAGSSFIAILINNTTTALSGNYRIYADLNGDNYFNPVIDTLVAGPSPFNLAAGPGTTAILTGAIPAANQGQDLFLVLTITSGTADGASRVVFLPSTICSPLPVTFNSLTGRRTNRSMVSLKWETATEVNNSGFILQRSYSDNRWEDITFLPSQALAGNSTALLTYTYNDPNDHPGISQYRILQVDIDGRAKFSDVLSVRGYGQPEKTRIYPNPSADGNFTIVFDEARDARREVNLIDVNGRITRRWSAVSGNTLQVSNLQPGVYTIQIILPKTGERTIEKLVVFKR